MITVTPATLKETLDLQDAISTATKLVVVLWKSDDGEWFSRSHANEAAASEFETRCRKSGTEYRRA